jgi:soluble lytic murein transglycosylase-like protein
MSARYDIDPNLIAIIMTMESGGDPKASSYAGAKGLMQVTAPTARDIAAKFIKQPANTYNLEDPTTNIEFGTAYLAHLRDTFSDTTQSPSWNATVELIAAGYNGGPGAAASVAKGTGLRDMQTVSYARDAFNMWRERHADSSPTFLRWQDRGGSGLIQNAQKEIK